MRTSRLAAFAALALLATQAVADNHVREYVVPYVPGAERATFRNIVIVVTNHKGQSAPISINAHVNRSGRAQSCGSLTNLAPFEIRRLARNAGTLCVARDEGADSSLRIRTVEGVHVTGYLVLDASRNNALVPLDVFNVTPAGTTPTPPEPPEPPAPEGISITGLTLEYTGRRYRLSFRLRNSGDTWPGPLVACVHVRDRDSNETELFNGSETCSLPNDDLRGWADVGGGATYLNITTQDGTQLSELVTDDYTLSRDHRRDPLTYRVCINGPPVNDVIPPPITCDTVSIIVAAGN